MSLLSKAQIEVLISNKPSLLKRFNDSVSGSPQNQIRESSFDVTIGNIYIPGSKDDDLGGLNRPYTNYVLSPGECAVIKTFEVLSMPSNVGGIGFPPSTDISLGGILTTNPGHIDPSFEGHLHLTVINMGSEEFSLRQNDRIMRILFFSLPGPDNGIRKAAADPINEVLLDRLSADFLNVGERAQKAANNAVTRGQIMFPLLVALITLIATAVGGYFTVVKDISGDITDIQKSESKLEGEIAPVTNLQALKAVDERLARVESQLKAFQSKSASQNPTSRPKQ